MLNKLNVDFFNIYFFIGLYINYYIYEMSGFLKLLNGFYKLMKC